MPAWEQRKLGNELLFLRNNTLSRADLNGVQGDALDVHYGDVLVKYGAVLNVAKTTLPRITKSGQPGKTLGDPLNDGDIIMSDTAEDETAGKCSELCEIRDRTVYSGLHTIPCRPRRKYASGFLGHYLNAPVFHNQLIPLMQGIKVISLSKTSLSEANLVVPSIREQEKISATFSRLDTLITLHQRKHNNTDIGHATGEMRESTQMMSTPVSGSVYEPTDSDIDPYLAFYLSPTLGATHQLLNGDVTPHILVGILAEFHGNVCAVQLTGMNDLRHRPFVAHDIPPPSGTIRIPTPE